LLLLSTGFSCAAPSWWSLRESKKDGRAPTTTRCERKSSLVTSDPETIRDRIAALGKKERVFERIRSSLADLSGQPGAFLLGIVSKRLQRYGTSGILKKSPRAVTNGESESSGTKKSFASGLNQIQSFDKLVEAAMNARRAGK
jgi:hypothetical protein